MKFWPHDPNALRKYDVTISGDTISSAAWSVSPSGPTLGAATTTTTTSTIPVSDVSIGITYTLTVLLTCTSGQKFERFCKIRGDHE